MKIQIHTSEIRSGNRLIAQLGRCLMFLYIVVSYVAHSDYVPLSFNSLTLYGFLLMGLISFVFNKRFRISNLHFAWYGVFCALSLVWVLILGIYWPNSEWFSTFYQMLVILALSLSFAQFIESRKDIRLVCYAYMLGAVLLMAFLAAAGRLNEDQRLGTTVMGNANSFAGMYMMAAIMSVWMVLNGKNFWEKLLFLAGLIVIFYGLLLSGGRKFILIPFVVLYIMLLLRKDKRGRSHVLGYTLLILAVFGLLVWLMMTNETLYRSVGYRMQYLFNMIEGEGEIGASNEMRKNLMGLAFKEGLESPVWGHGFDSFKNLALQELSFYAYSHNNWTEMLHNYGLIGFAVYYWFYVKIVAGIWKYRRTAQDLTTFAIAVVIAAFVCEYGVVSYYEYQNQILFCIVAAMYGICVKEGSMTDGKV